MKAFITGSRAYGKPRDDSDIDLVILADEHAAGELEKHRGEDGAIRFGALNLIIARSETEFAVWKLGTDALKREGRRRESPIRRDVAKSFLGKLRALVRIEDLEYADAEP